ncbi:peptidoglycan DD-metalloendopeptidase family protein [Neorhizobium sp. NPDC001467]|uniref:peptidoglycan DD-metalloendopeptidase family protein n=1 Tax=Neorhizobium sp. NPDC001467 TaxID=3390595 RepID=UPI003CFC92D2
MRFQSSYKVGKSSLRFAALALLASAATGCSSDATRFDNLFSKTDNLTTASIPQRQGSGAYGQAPVPQGDINGGGMSAPMANAGGYQGSGGYQANAGYQNNGGYGGSMSANAAPSASGSVQRSELAAPSTSGAPATYRQQAMAQPMPASQNNEGLAPRSLSVPSADSAASAPAKSASGWTTANAPKVTVRAGESAASLAKRYGVPEKEILKANGGKVQAGQIAVIPTYGTPRNAAKAHSDGSDLAGESQAPMPQQPEQKVAALPGAPTARDKARSEGGKLGPAGGGKTAGGTYTVAPGDSLAKIARSTGTPIDQLKSANGLSTENLRIGQTLTLPNAGSDTAKTASIPAQPASAKPAQPAQVETASVAPQQAAKPAAEATPAATASVSEVEKKSDVASIAPSSTGISKYRWPVNGAVVAGYGANVNGSRNDGIDISVPEGTPIKAAENGVVIYAGNGLKQLGNTVLVRHDDGKVTVYGHAGNINVSRGQKVQRGQTLAASGMSGDAKRPQVHFEVRKDATPVNPITFLE